MNLLSLRKVAFSYGSGFALKDLNLEIEEGSFHALLGPNGCGKSTVVKLISGLIRPDGGSIRFRGRRLETISPRNLATEMAVIASENHFEFPFRVREVVEMGRFSHLGRLERMGPSDHQIVDDALNTTETASLSQRPISELSSGERQRVLMARAIAQRPSLLVLDEPNAHLDIRHQIAVFQLITRLNREQGVTVVVVLHDLAMAAAYAHSVAVMDGGRIVKTGSPKEVINEEMIQEVYGTRVRVLENKEGWPLIDYTSERESPSDEY